MKTSIPPVLMIFALVCFAFDQNTQAVSPPPDGGYPNFTTAAGDHALQALTLGVGNTAIGTFSLFSVTTGNFNTAVGAGSLDLNTADSNTATGAAALLFNTTGAENTANGTAALEFNHTAATTRPMERSRLGSMLIPLITPLWVPRRSLIMTRMGWVSLIITRQLASRLSPITLMAVGTQPWVQGQGQT